MMEFIKNLAENAGKILSDSSLKIQSLKEGNGNWVTAADMAIEKHILTGIKSKYPSDFILSEESYSELPKKIPSRMWIVDPLDGTTNATFGYPHYGVSIAFMEQGGVTHAAIYDIPNKKLFWAKRGEGTYMEEEKVTMRNLPLKGNIVCFGGPYKHDAFVKTISSLDSIHKAGSRFIIVGSAVMAAMYTITNTFSMYYEHGLSPWDVAASSLIVQEAGGVAKDERGDLDVLNFDLFACGSGKAVGEFLELNT